MLASPCSGAYGGTGFCKLFFEVVNIFGVGMTVEVVHRYRAHDGTVALTEGGDGASVGQFFLVEYTCY